MVQGKWWLLITILYLLITNVTHVSADTLQDQRQRYQEIKQAWDSKQMDVVQQLMPTLRNYPLYPYLVYRQLNQNLNDVTVSQVRVFINQYTTLPVAKTLTERFVNELARRQDWYGLLNFSAQAPNTESARCNYYYAKWVVGDKQTAWQGADALWLSGKTLPASCEKLFEVWRQAGKQSADKTFERIKLGFKENNDALVNKLVQQLPPENQSLGAALVRLQKNPASVKEFAFNATPSDFSRSIITSALVRVARKDIETARTMIPTLVSLQKMNSIQALDLEKALALRLMKNDVTFEQAQWRDNVVQRSQSEALLERRIRLAINRGDRDGIKFWMTHLPQQARLKHEWRYWWANVLLASGKKGEGEAILHELTRVRGFYPMVAAEKLKIPYTIKVTPVSHKASSALINLAPMKRVRELMYWNLDNVARSEWVSFVASRSKIEQESLARYAYEQNWADLSVQATIIGKMWDHLEERFPLTWAHEFQKATRDKTITTSYAMAIARQESAWDPKARSPVGAAGLMQIMPKTAQETVKMFNVSGYKNASQLLDPYMNIAIGTTYLDALYQKFGRNRILSSAAYNAGPTRVNNWLNNSTGALDAVAFIESIPFVETRNYVKNVLVYDAFYRHFLMKRPVKIFTDTEWQRYY